MKNPYRVLGLRRDATEEQIHKAYRARAKKYRTATPATRKQRPNLPRSTRPTEFCPTRNAVPGTTPPATPPIAGTDPTRICCAC